MTELVSLQGPVELVDGKLMIRIPLGVGGDKLAPLARGVGTVEGEWLIVTIPPWLAEKLQVGAGTRVVVDNADGKLNIRHTLPDEGPPPAPGAA